MKTKDSEEEEEGKERNRSGTKRSSQGLENFFEKISKSPKVFFGTADICSVDKNIVAQAGLNPR